MLKNIKKIFTFLNGIETSHLMFAQFFSILFISYYVDLRDNHGLVFFLFPNFAAMVLLEDETRLSVLFHGFFRFLMYGPLVFTAVIFMGFLSKWLLDQPLNFHLGFAAFVFFQYVLWQMSDNRVVDKLKREKRIKELRDAENLKRYNDSLGQ